MHSVISSGGLHPGHAQPRQLRSAAGASRQTPAPPIPAAKALRLVGAVICAPLLPLLTVLACLGLALAVYLRCIAALAQYAWQRLNRTARPASRSGKPLTIPRD